MKKRKKPVKLRVVFGLIVFISIFAILIVLGVALRLLNIDFVRQDAAYGGSALLGIRMLLIAVCVVAGITIEQFVNKKIFKPLNALNHSMDEVTSGNFNLKLSTDSRILEIKEIMSHFNTMAAELSSIEMFRNDFISSVSHEFKTPIAAIEGFATLLQSADLTAEERETYTNYIINSTKRLSNLSDNILKLSRLEQQELILDKKEFNLSEQVRVAILTLEREWSKKEIELEIEIDEIQYHGNQDLLFQVWMNLINNAVKFTPNCGLIKVLLKQKNEQIIFQVIDNGVGMSDENRKRIFEKFYQSDKSHNSQGNGLGLPLVRRIISLHDGIINVESELGSGSTFTVTLV